MSSVASLGVVTALAIRDRPSSHFLKNFPKDFQYVLGLQEMSAVTMGEGFAQAIREPVFVNLHASADTGNGMKKILRAK